MSKKKLSYPKSSRSTYCTKCGSRCVVVKKELGFDAETGERTFAVSWHCPNRSFFSLGHTSVVRSGDYWNSAPAPVRESELEKYQ